MSTENVMYVRGRLHPWSAIKIHGQPLEGAPPGAGGAVGVLLVFKTREEAERGTEAPVFAIEPQERSDRKI